MGKAKRNMVSLNFTHAWNNIKLLTSVKHPLQLNNRDPKLEP